MIQTGDNTTLFVMISLVVNSQTHAYACIYGPPKCEKNPLKSKSHLVSVPDPKPTLAWITFSIVCIILEVIYVLDEVWGQD